MGQAFVQFVDSGLRIGYPDDPQAIHFVKILLRILIRRLTGPVQTENSPFLRVLNGEANEPPPIWFMRQAGRYLPEYRAVRAKAGSFLDLCFNPELAAEVTLQPVRRYGLDAAILFADILLIPLAMGQNVGFVEGEGPRLSPPITPAGLSSLETGNNPDRLSPVYETVRRVRAALPEETALIGFAGAPWTVATYMLAGGTTRDPSALRTWAYRDPAFIDALIAMLTDATADYLIAQVEAGAQAVQLFDTWAGGLPEEFCRKVCLDPVRKIAGRVKAAHPGTPVIFFPRGTGALAEAFAAAPECDAIGIDTGTPAQWARRVLAPHAAVQGGLDPLLTITGGAPMRAAAETLCRTFEGTPYIFNLGHGFTPETPPENVADLVRIVRRQAN